MGKKPTLGAIHQQILDLLKADPSGLSIYDIRDRLPGIDVQQHLDKRVRELRKLYKIPRRKVAGRWVYVFDGDADKTAVDDGAINAKLRAEILHPAHGRCQMCGRTVLDDGVKLQIDHKIPRTWGGATVPENLWAICQLCNGGKRDYFATFNDSDMKKIMAKESVYERIAVPSRMITSPLGDPPCSWQDQL